MWEPLKWIKDGENAPWFMIGDFNEAMWQTKHFSTTKTLERNMANLENVFLIDWFLFNANLLARHLIVRIRSSRVTSQNSVAASGPRPCTTWRKNWRTWCGCVCDLLALACAACRSWGRCHIARNVRGRVRPLRYVVTAWDVKTLDMQITVAPATSSFDMQINVAPPTSHATLQRMKSRKHPIVARLQHSPVEEEVFGAVRCSRRGATAAWRATWQKNWHNVGWKWKEAWRGSDGDSEAEPAGSDQTKKEGKKSRLS